MVDMISFRLLLAALLWAGAALFVFELGWYFLERKLALLKRLPPEMVEDNSAGYFVSRFIMQFAFLVAVPTLAYSWFYVQIPFYGVRAGVATAVFLFLMGIVPYSIMLFMRLKLPLAFTLVQLAGYLLKLIIVYSIIAYLYIL
jgi:hypothetical protein